MAEGPMEAERITLSQRERDRLKVSHSPRSPAYDWYNRLRLRGHLAGNRTSRELSGTQHRFTSNRQNRVHPNLDLAYAGWVAGLAVSRPLPYPDRSRRRLTNHPAVQTDRMNPFLAQPILSQLCRSEFLSYTADH